MPDWLLIMITVVSVVCSSYFAALCLISAFRGEPVFRWTRPWWSRRHK